MIAQKCGPNEYWDVNGEPCIRSVQDPRPKCLFEPPEPGCVCNTGFVRNGANKQCEPISTIGNIKHFSILFLFSLKRIHYSIISFKPFYALC